MRRPPGDRQRSGAPDQRSRIMLLRYPAARGEPVAARECFSARTSANTCPAPLLMRHARMDRAAVTGACPHGMSLPGLPLGVELGPLGVPGGDRCGEPGAVTGVAALVVGGPVA